MMVIKINIKNENIIKETELNRNFTTQKKKQKKQHVTKTLNPISHFTTQ